VFISLGVANLGLLKQPLYYNLSAVLQYVFGITTKTSTISYVIPPP